MQILPTSFDIPVPKLSNMAQLTVLSGAMGLVYGKLTDVSPLLSALIFATAQLANCILFLIAKRAWNRESVHEHSIDRVILVPTTFATQMLGVVAIRHFHLIEKTGTIFWTIFTLVMSARLLTQAFDEKKFLPLNYLYESKVK